MGDMRKSDATAYLMGSTTREFKQSLQNLIQHELEYPLSSQFDDNFNKVLHSAKALRGVAVPYAQISSMIFTIQSENLTTNDGILPILERFKNNLTNGLKSVDGDVVPDEWTILLKTYENMSLSDAQYQALLGQENVEKLNDDVQHIQESIDKANESFDQRMNTIYSGFVSVLGIFVAITFTLFGGMNLLERIFSSISKGATQEDAGLAIMLSGIFAILIYLIILGLTAGLSRLTKENNFYNFWSDFSFRTLFVIISISVGIVIFGFMYSHGSIFWNVPGIRDYQFKWTALNVLILYIFIVLIIYRHGDFLKNWVVNPIRYNGYETNRRWKSDVVVFLIFIIIFTVVFGIL